MYLKNSRWTGYTQSDMFCCRLRHQRFHFHESYHLPREASSILHGDPLPGHTPRQKVLGKPVEFSQKNFCQSYPFFTASPNKINIPRRGYRQISTFCIRFVTFQAPSRPVYRKEPLTWGSTCCCFRNSKFRNCLKTPALHETAREYYKGNSSKKDISGRNYAAKIEIKETSPMG